MMITNFTNLPILKVNIKTYLIRNTADLGNTFKRHADDYFERSP
jgi:hypothetical protein